MSAWIVSKKHIDALVSHLIMCGIIDHTDADRVGRMLWAENHKSVCFRYSKRYRTPAYKYENVSMTHPAYAKVWDCWDYQTCEHPSYRRSRARRMYDMAMAHVGFELAHTTEEYNSTPWGL